MQPAVRPASALPRPRPRSRRPWWQLVLWAGAIAALVVLWSNVLWPNRYLVPAVFGEGIYQVQTPAKMVALTFDDGPDPRYTAEISQILAAAGAKGTFFVMGRHAEQYPELVHTLMQQGHELGNHTWNHPSLRWLSPQRIREELESTDHLLRDLGYQGPIPFRSPYGHSLLTLPYVLKQRHQANVLWTVQMNDWKPETPEVMMALLAPKFGPGAIVLMHDGDGASAGADRHHTVELVRRILAKYAPQGYQFVTISELLASGPAQHHWY